MKKIGFKFLSLLLAVVIVFSCSFVSSAAPDITSTIDEPSAENMLVDEIVWIGSNDSRWNLGYNNQTVIRGKDKSVGDWFEVHKTDSTASGIAVSMENSENTIDITGMQFIEFDFYLTEEALTVFDNATDASLELSSSGKCDNSELSVSLSMLKELGLNAGWNSIKLDLETFNSREGETGPFNKKSLNYFRFYVVDNSDELWWYRLGDIKFTKYSKRSVFDFQKAAVGGDGNIAVSENGVSTVVNNTANMGIQISYKNITDFRDLTGMEYLEFDFYISDTDIMKNAADLQFEVRSNGCIDDNSEMHWNKTFVNDMHLKNGWNHIKLRLDGASHSGSNAFDISAVSWFRFYAVGLPFTVTTAEIRIEDISFTKDVNTSEKLVLSSCGADIGVEGATANANHYSHYDCKYSQNYGMFAIRMENTDITDYDFLEFDLWVEDSTELLKNDSQIELTSSGVCDIDEIKLTKIQLEGLKIKNGWNHFKLALSDFVSSEQGVFNPKAINFFRIYFVGYNKGLMIDDLCVTKYRNHIDLKKSGDVNGDGFVDVRDIVRIKKHLAFVLGTTVNTNNADLNDDGKVTLIDTVKLRKRLIGDKDELLYYLDFNYIKGEFYNNTETEFDVVNFLFSLQGVLNREKPILFVDYIADTDSFWYDYLKNDDKLLYEYGRNEIRSFDDLVEIFRDEISDYGLVLWDEDVPATSNVAATVCAVTNALPVRAGSELQNRLLLNTEAQVKVDLNNKFKGEGDIPDINRKSTGSAKCDAYLWAAKYYEDVINWSVLGNYVDAYPNIVSPDLCLANHDYIIANKGFFYDLSPWNDETPCDDTNQPLGADYNTLIEIMDMAYKHNNGSFGTVCGYVPWPYKYSNYADKNSAHTSVNAEHRMVEILSSFNMVLDADSAPHGELSNASVYMHHRLKESYQNNHAENVGTYNPDKEYVMIYMGDYDSSAWTARQVPRMFNDEARGEFDITWSFNLNISDRCPMIFDYVYENKTEHDFFSAGNSGVGYVMPNVLINRTDSNYPSATQKYIEYCKPYLERFDIDYLGAVIASEDLTDAELNMYADMGFKQFAHSRKDQGIVLNDRIIGVNFRGLPEGSRDYTWCSKVVSNMIDSYGDINVLVIRSILWTPTEIKQLRNKLSQLRKDIVFSCNPEQFIAMTNANQK